MNPAPFADVRGVVAAFDEAAGWGTLHTEAGAEVFFHCTRIADGTRTIPVGVTVAASIAPIGLGDFEAVGVRQSAG